MSNDVPSRRTILHALGVGVLPFAGCGERQPNTDARTARPETRPTTSNPTSSPTTDSPTTTPEQTPQESQCPDQWTQEDVWVFGNDIRTPVAAAGENVVYTATETELVALDPETGNPLWRTATETVSESFGVERLIAVGNRVLGVGYGHVAALDAETGQLSWVFAPPGKPQTVSLLSDSATIVGDSVYVGVVNENTPSFEAENPYSRLYEVDISTGESRVGIEFSTDSSRLPTPKYLVGNDKRLFCTLDDRLVALTLDGNTEWRTSPFGGGYPTLAHSDGIVVASSGAALHAFESRSGRQLWKDSELRGGVAVVDGVGYATDETIPEGHGQLTAFDPKTGAHYWEAQTRGRGSTPVVGSGAVFVTVTAEDETLLTAFDAERGCRLGTFELAGGGGPPVVGGGRVSVYSGTYHDWRLLSFSPP